MTIQINKKELQTFKSVYNTNIKLTYFTIMISLFPHVFFLTHCTAKILLKPLDGLFQHLLMIDSCLLGDKRILLKSGIIHLQDLPLNKTRRAHWVIFIYINHQVYDNWFKIFYALEWQCRNSTVPKANLLEVNWPCKMLKSLVNQRTINEEYICIF